MIRKIDWFIGNDSKWSKILCLWESVSWSGSREAKKCNSCGSWCFKAYQVNLWSNIMWKIYPFLIPIINPGQVNECGFVWILIKIMMHETGFNDDLNCVHFMRFTLSKQNHGWLGPWFLFTENLCFISNQ